MLTHLVSLLARALSEFPTVLSGNWLSILLPLVVYTLLEAPKLWKGWPAMTQDMRRAFWRDSSILLGIYILLFAWAVVRTIYQDHVGLANRVAQVRIDAKRNADATTAKEAELQTAYQQIQISCARTQGANDTLLTQNRDQQNSINNCQTQALKLLTPIEPKTTVLALKEFDPNSESQDVEFLLLTNTPITPVKMRVQCNTAVDQIQTSVVGGMSMGPEPQRQGPNGYLTEVDTPAWTPVTPFRVRIKYRGKGIGCSFSH